MIVRRVRHAEVDFRRGRPQIMVILEAREAVDFGRWLKDQKHGDQEMGSELVKLAHEAWEDEG